MKRLFLLALAVLLFTCTVSHAATEATFRTVEEYGFRFSVPNDCEYAKSGDGINGGYFVGPSMSGPLYFMVFDDVKQTTVDSLGLDEFFTKSVMAIGGNLSSYKIITIDGVQSMRWSGTYEINQTEYPSSGFLFYHDSICVVLLVINISNGDRDADEALISNIIDSFHCLALLPPESEASDLTQSIPYDLSGMSFSDLLTLRRQIDTALWASDGWQTVDVPAGSYIIGDDIPAGRWTITGHSNYVEIYRNEAEYQNKKRFVYEYLSDGETYNATLENGQYLCISMGNCSFSPYTGAGLGFK